MSVLFGCPKENQGFYQCVDDPDPVEHVLNDNTCGGKPSLEVAQLGLRPRRRQIASAAFCTKRVSAPTTATR